MPDKMMKKIMDKFLLYYSVKRRSLVAVRKIPKGKIIEASDIAIKRPGSGVPVELFDVVVGSLSTRDIMEDEILHYGGFALQQKEKEK
jgi:sialic acid synthase SpsE